MEIVSGNPNSPPGHFAARILGIAACVSVVTTFVGSAAVGVTPGNVVVALAPVFNAGAPVVGMARAPDDRLYVCTLNGKVLVHAGGVSSVFLDLASIADVPFLSGGANGLYGLAFHPGFNDPESAGYRLCYTYHDERKFVSGTGGALTGLPDFWSPEQYVPGSPAPTTSNYTLASFDHFNVVREWSVNVPLDGSAPAAVAASSRVVVRLAHPNGPGHNGSGPRWGPDGLLYLAVGDGGGSGNDYSGSTTNPTDGHTDTTGNAQDLTSVFGKVLRIDPIPGGANGALSANGQYRIPDDNPFVGDGGGVVGEIYAFGLRNPWGLAFDDRSGGDGALYLGNPGQHHREEFERIVTGGNHGWGYREGSVPLIAQDNYSGEDLAGPVVLVRAPPDGFTSILPLAEYKTRRQYAPDGAAAEPANLTGDGTAATGGFVYRGTAIPALIGQLVAGDYSTGATPPMGSGANRGRLFYLDPAEAPAGVSIHELQLAAGGTIPAALLAFGEDRAGELYALFANGDVSQIVPPPGAPAIITPPAMHTVTAGGAAAFAVVANGAGPFSYQWQRNGVDIDGAIAARHAIPSVQRFHAGTYSVVVSNSSGSTTQNIATLAVPAAPSSGAHLLNLSTRGFVGTGAAIMISGVVISSEGPKTLLVRAVGPTLASDPLNVPGALADPKLTIFSGQTPILSNDDWGDNPDADYTKTVSAAVFAFGLPEGSKDAALVVTLPPGSYTIHASSTDGVGTGVALVEVYVVE